MNEQHIKHLIEQRKREIAKVSAQSKAGRETVTLDQTRVGRLSRVEAMQAQAMNQAGQRRRDHEIGRLDQALQRLAADEYGECEQCAEAISEGRLNVDPAALYCIRCASLLEGA